jgi:hypothetical protein
VPRENLTIHRDVNSRRQQLHRAERQAEIEQPSELLNVYGTIAPTSTIVLASCLAASRSAVCTIVSVPCVMMSLVSVAAIAAWQMISRSVRSNRGCL